MIVLAIDPGKTCGWAVFYGDSVLAQRFKTDRGGEIFTGQVTDSEIYDLINSHLPDVVIYEYFKPRELPKVDTTAIEVIGVVKRYKDAVSYDVELIPQQPSHAKFFWTNKKLKKVGLYKPGQPHANDALRHLLTYLMKKRPEEWVKRLIEK